MQNSNEPSFRENVDLMYDRAAATLDLPIGLADQIRTCNSVYQVKFGVKIRGEYKVFSGWRAVHSCLLYTSPSPRDKRQSRMPSSA